MNQLCKVCGEPAAGFHFGAFTCEGCKSFFGRTYNNISAIAGCKNNGDCVINKKNRTACKACRLRKCLLVGMSKSGSRYGRRSNWFKIHCLLQEQQQGTGSGGGPGGGGGGGAAGTNNFEQFTRLHQMQARQTYQDKTNPCIKSASMSPTLSLAAVGLSQQQAAAAASATIQQQQQQPTQRLPHYLTAAKFLNGVIAANCNETKSSTAAAELRLSVTPSDSGASSAGDVPDDCNSTSAASHGRGSSSNKKFITTAAAVNHISGDIGDNAFRDCEEEQESRRRQLLQIFRSHSEPLKSPFAAFAMNNLPPPILAVTPPLHFLPARTLPNTEIRIAASEDNVRLSTSSQEQHEPIDLSLKATREGVAFGQRHCSRTTSPTTSECGGEDSGGHSSMLNNLDVISKPTPLDLTLVRSQGLTG